MSNRIKVWDPVVRVFHWSLVIAFFTAYFTEPEDAALALHVWAGYLVGGLVVLRVVWGFVGSPHARFRDFAFGPFAALRYLRDLSRSRAERHLGHSPAGAWMIYLLLATLAATVALGMTTLAIEKRAGPLAPLFAPASAATAIAQDREDDDEGGAAGHAVEEIHETLGNVALALVLLHVLGVALASVAYRENLVRSMVTGYKRADDAA